MRNMLNNMQLPAALNPDLRRGPPRLPGQVLSLHFQKFVIVHLLPLISLGFLFTDRILIVIILTPLAINTTRDTHQR